MKPKSAVWLADCPTALRCANAAGVCLVGWFCGAATTTTAIYRCWFDSARRTRLTISALQRPTPCRFLRKWGRVRFAQWWWKWSMEVVPKDLPAPPFVASASCQACQACQAATKQRGLRCDTADNNKMTACMLGWLCLGRCGGRMHGITPAHQKVRV